MSLLDRTMLGALASKMDVGIYDQALKLVNILLTLVTSLGSVMLPRLLKEFKSLIPYRYDDLSNARNKLTPSQYQEHMKPIVARWEHTADSLIQICRPSAKAARLIKNKADLQAGAYSSTF